MSLITKNCPGLLKLNLKGGFGNQMFQLACATNLCKSNGHLLELNHIDNYRKFSLNLLGLQDGKTYKVQKNSDSIEFKEAKKCWHRKFEYYQEQNFEYEEIRLNSDHINLEGYFQSERYFLDISSEFRNTMLKFFRLERKPANDDVVVHVRLGDLIANPEFGAVHGIVTQEYLIAAIKLLANDTSKIYVVTDDQENIHSYFPLIFSIFEVEIISRDMVSDFVSLATSANLVISNSTYSWWAAFLGDNKVVAPHQWFADLQKYNTKDLFRRSWILL